MYESTCKNRQAPERLYVLFSTEMWERFNYYGMRAILVLFMTKALLFNDVFSSNLYGSYISLIYLTPLLGGYIADRYWGNKRSIFVGGLVMVAGELILICLRICLSFFTRPFYALFFSGLGFMIAGNGFFKPNISSLVGQLYKENDKRKDSAYTIFYMGINVGGMVGPLVCGFFGDTGNPADFKWAFLVGGIAMLISLVVQKLYHDKYVLSPDGKILGETPGTDQSDGKPETREKHEIIPAPPKIALNPAAIIVGMLCFAGLMIGAMYLDTRINYLFYLLSGSFVFIIFIFSLIKTLPGKKGNGYGL